MSKLTWYNIAICLVVSWGGFSYGFGFAIFVTSLGQPTFYEYLNLNRKSAGVGVGQLSLISLKQQATIPQSKYLDSGYRSRTNDAFSILGAINALFNFGLAVGALGQGWLVDVIGRKNAFAVAAVSSLVGAALITSSTVIGMLIAVRLLHGLGLGMLICLVPLYLTEVAPPRQRGLLSGLTTMSFGMGYLICSWISIGTYYAKTFNVQVRAPFALAMVGPLALLIGLPFIPETPRYLCLKNRPSEAWEVLRKIHHDPEDVVDAAAHAEFVQITRQVDFDKEQKAGYIEMFKKPSWRKRALLTIFIQFAAQSTGILGIANFLILIFTSLGMSGVMPLLLYAIYTTIGTTCVFIAIFTVDRVGRRTMFLLGFPLLALCLLLEGVLQWQYLGSDHQGGLAACVLIIYVYIVMYQFVDGPSFIWMSEIFPTNIRGRGIGLGFFSYFVGAITYTTPSALAFKNVKYRMYFLYMGLCIISTVIVYLYIPETKLLPVEEIGALFGDEVVVHLTDDGHGIVEEQMELKLAGENVQVAEVHHAEKV